jgi:hypothetical protein
VVRKFVGFRDAFVVFEDLFLRICTMGFLQEELWLVLNLLVDSMIKKIVNCLFDVLSDLRRKEEEVLLVMTTMVGRTTRFSISF